MFNNINAIEHMKKVLAIFLCSIIAGSTPLSLRAQETATENETLDLQFYASPSQVVKGDRVRLDWESGDADYCEASGSWSGRREISGSVKVVAKKKTATYELECFDEEGNASEKIVRQITVVTNKKKLKRKKLPTPTAEISAQSHARAEEDVEMAWSSPKGTVACWATGPDDWEGLKAPHASGIFSVENGKEYSLTCWNQNGEVGQRVVHVFEKKPNKYTARDVGLNQDYLPMYPDDFTLADGREVYFIDFIKKDERSAAITEDDLYYWGKRIVIDPDTNLRIEDKDVLKQLNAFTGQVPPDAIPSSKLIKVDGPISYTAVYESYKDVNDDLERFTNSGEFNKNAEIPTLSPSEVYALAVEYTLEHLDLPKTQTYKDLYKPSTLAIWFNGTVAGVPMFYETTVYDWKDEKIRQIVLDPYTGEDVTSKEFFDNGVWDRTVLTVREPLNVNLVETPINPSPTPIIMGEPVGNPPILTPVLPPSEKISAPTPTPKPIIGEPVGNPPALTPVLPPSGSTPPTSTPSASSQCPTNATYSPILGTCVDNGPTQSTSEAQPHCPEGQTYSHTFHQCF